MENIEKLNIPAALLAGIYSSEQSSLLVDLNLITLENQAIAEYTKLLQKEIEKLGSEKGSPKTPENSEQNDKELFDLENAFKIIYKFSRKIPQRSVALEELESAEQRLMLSLADRKREYERLMKHHESLMSDPKLKEQFAELDTLKLEIETEKLRLEGLTKEKENISAQVDAKQQRNQILLEEVKRELSDVERQITETELCLTNNEEEMLAAEIAKIELQLNKLQANIDGDGFSSECSDSTDNTSAATPVFEKLTTDLSSLFKNPNDFPFEAPKPTQTFQKPKSQSLFSLGGAKKSRVLFRSSKTSHPPKSPVPVLTSKRQQAFAKSFKEQSASIAIVVPSPVVISPPSEEKQPQVKILRIENLPPMLQTITEEVVKSSESSQVKIPFTPRTLSKEYESPKKQEVDTELKNLLSPENQIELVAIPETPKDKNDEIETAVDVLKEVTPMEIDFNEGIFDSGNNEVFNTSGPLGEQDASFEFSDGGNIDASNFMDYDPDNSDFGFEPNSADQNTKNDTFFF